MQPLGRVDHRRLSLLDLRAQASLPADEIGKGSGFLFIIRTALDRPKDRFHCGCFSAFRQFTYQIFNHVAGKFIPLSFQFSGESANRIIFLILKQFVNH